MGEATYTEDYDDRSETPGKTAETTRTAAAHAAHLAARLQEPHYQA